MQNRGKCLPEFCVAVSHQAKTIFRKFMRNALIILASLVTGLLLGILIAGHAEWLVEMASVIGTMWLNALRMTIIPLVVSILIVGVVQAAAMARAGQMTMRAIITMLIILWASAAMAAVLTPTLLSLFPLPAEAASALRGALLTAEPTGEVPPFSEFLRAIIPTNPVAAAAQDAILPLIIFTLAFAFATTRLPEAKRTTIADFFSAISDTMLILINWILLLAPVGVFALALVVGAKAGAEAFGALIHYVLIVSAIGLVIWLASFVLAAVGGRMNPLTFFRASMPAQAVAISTQSSLASLPAMVGGVKLMGVGERSADVVLPIAVALFRATGPCMNLAVAIYVAHLMGIELSVTALAIGVAAAAITTMGAVSLPGSVSFITSVAPICIAMGVPIEPLALLLAIETFPDIMRTLGNVTMDMAVTSTVARFEDDVKSSG
jgi:proton glutamate symport protein